MKRLRLCGFARFGFGIPLGAVLASVAVPTQGQTLRVGYFDLPPHIASTSESRPEPGGPAIEYLKTIAKTMGVDISIEKTALPLARLLNMLKENELQAAVSLAKTSEREKTIRFPSRPFFIMEQVVAVPAVSPLQAIDRVTDLKGMTIGTQSEAVLPAIMMSPELKLAPIPGNDVIWRNLKKLVEGRIDAAYWPDGFGTRFVAKVHGIGNAIRILPLPAPSVKLYTAFSFAVPIEIINRYEDALKENEPYEALLKKMLDGTS